MRGASVCGLKLRLVHASFDIRADLRADLRGSWHALAVSVSPADGGVTVMLDTLTYADVYLRADLRGSWHALAVSVSPADGGVTVFLDGKVLAIHALFSYAGYADVC
jgi:hypothetical protein